MLLNSSRLKRLIEEAEASPEVSDEELQDLYQALEDLESSTFQNRASDDLTLEVEEIQGNRRLYVAIGSTRSNDFDKVKEYSSNRKDSPLSFLSRTVKAGQIGVEKFARLFRISKNSN